VDIVLDLYLRQAQQLAVGPRLWLLHLASNAETPLTYIQSLRRGSTLAHHGEFPRHLLPRW
jgi:hypothetical protein